MLRSNQERVLSSMQSFATQADDLELGLNPSSSCLSSEVEILLQRREQLKLDMKGKARRNCEGKDEYVTFDNYIKLQDLSHYKKFIWPTCKKGLTMNLEMYDICKKLWNLNYRDDKNYLEAYYIFI